MLKIKRKVLLGCLNMVMPVISTKSAVEHQVLNFYNGRLQATNGNVWLDTVLPEEFNEISFKIKAEPLYLLLKKLTVKDISLDISEFVLKIVGKNIEGEFAIAPATPDIIPQMKDSLEVPLDNFKDLAEGLKFCRLGVAPDGTVGPLSGVHIFNDSLWSCDNYRILNWKLKSDLGLNCCVPVKLVEIFHNYQDEVESMRFKAGKNYGGCLGLSLKDSTSIWAACIEGEYKDISSFMPDGDGAEVIELPEDFPSALDRHLGNLKDVKNDSKEVKFEVRSDDLVTSSQKFAVSSESDRKLVELVPLKVERTGTGFEFYVNPILLKDIVGLALNFNFFPESGIVLFSTDQFRYLIRARG